LDCTGECEQTLLDENGYFADEVHRLAALLEDTRVPFDAIGQFFDSALVGIRPILKLAQLENRGPDLVGKFLLFARIPLDAPHHFAAFVRLLDRALQAKHGDAIGEIADLENAIAIADRAITAARETLGEDVGGIANFEEAAKPYEEQLGVLWLRKDVGVDGVETVKIFKQISPREGSWVEATLPEREAGQFFKDYNEWHAAGGVWPKVERKLDAA
jgi:hypothetical protein